MSRSILRPVLLCLLSGWPIALVAQQGGKLAETPLRLSSEQAVELAIRNNLDLKASILNEVVSRARIREELGAFDPALFADFTGGRSQVLFASNFPSDPTNPNSPTVTSVISTGTDTVNTDFGVRGRLDTGFSYQLIFTNNYRFQQGGSNFNPIYTSSSQLTFTQPMLRNGWTLYNRGPLERVRLEALASHQNYRGLARDKIKEVQQAYYDLVFAIEDRDVKRTSVALAQEQLKITSVKVRTRSLARVELTTAESGLAGRQADLISAEAAVVAAEDRLRRLILSFVDKRDWETHIIPSEHARSRLFKLKSRSQILALAMQSDPAVLEQQLRVAQSEIDVSRAESGILPKLDMTGSLGVTGLSEDAFRSIRQGYTKQGALSWSVGLALEIPIGNRQASGRLWQARLQRRQARIQLQIARTDLIFNVRGALRDIDVAARSIKARREATRLALEQLKNERLKLDLRTSTNLQVFQVEDQLSQRRTEEIRAMLDYRLALLELERVSAVSLQSLVAHGFPEAGPSGRLP